jgi:hypothetical protein
MYHRQCMAPSTTSEKEGAEHTSEILLIIYLPRVAPEFLQHSRATTKTCVVEPEAPGWSPLRPVGWLHQVRGAAGVPRVAVPLLFFLREPVPVDRNTTSRSKQAGSRTGSPRPVRREREPSSSKACASGAKVRVDMHEMPSQTSSMTIANRTVC